ncbi:hypothetical protein ACHWQZ_G013653 [Mnemiopsis leidyi]
MISTPIKTVTENQKAVLGSLLDRADALTKKVISAYSPTTKYNVNLQNFKRFNADHMEAAATFLGFNVRADSKKLYKNLALLSDRVILKIESLFESTCLDCGDKYSNDLADTPPLVCHLCLQGSHNCEKAKEKAKLSPRPSGLVWLCFDCFRKNDLALMTKDSGKVGQLENVTEEDEDEDEDESTEERISPRRNRSPHEKQAIICEAYKKRECRHGLTGKRLINGKPCPHKHPPRCFRWCKHGENKRSGCTKGEECTYFHPKLCKNSVLKRYCANRDCSFHHLKHARRPRAQPPLETRRKTESKREESSSQPDPRFSSQPRAAPLSTRFRWDSVSTLNGANYAPTIEKKARPDIRERKLSTRSVTDQADTFLLQYLENMKEGIVLQLSDKVAEMQESIPLLVKEQLQIQMNRPPVPQPPLYQIPPQVLQMTRPLSQTAPVQPPLPFPGFHAQFPACSY